VVVVAGRGARWQLGWASWVKSRSCSTSSFEAGAGAVWGLVHARNARVCQPLVCQHLALLTACQTQADGSQPNSPPPLPPLSMSM
jgi:hypothetical protein